MLELILLTSGGQGWSLKTSSVLQSRFLVTSSGLSGRSAELLGLSLEIVKIFPVESFMFQGRPPLPDTSLVQSAEWLGLVLVILKIVSEVPLMFQGRSLMVSSLSSLLEESLVHSSELLAILLDMVKICSATIFFPCGRSHVTS